MQAFATETITRAALSAGLPEGRVMQAVAADNLTLKRPRVELRFLPEKYTRTGRKLAVKRTETEQIRKRELYEVELTVEARVEADDEAWLESFSRAFIVNLPRGGKEALGNWVRVRVQKGTFWRAPDQRLGEGVIKVFTRVNRVFALTFTGRITREEREALIPSHTITATTK